jgi:hypothetical protein
MTWMKGMENAVCRGNKCKYDTNVHVKTSLWPHADVSHTPFEDDLQMVKFIGCCMDGLAWYTE